MSDSKKFIVELWLDGYDTQADHDAACEEFIRDQLNFTASDVKVTPMETPPPSVQPQPAGRMEQRAGEWEPRLNFDDFHAWLDTFRVPNTGESYDPPKLEIAEWAFAQGYRKGLAESVPEKAAPSAAVGVWREHNQTAPPPTFTATEVLKEMATGTLAMPIEYVVANRKARQATQRPEPNQDAAPVTDTASDLTASDAKGQGNDE